MGFSFKVLRVHPEVRHFITGKSKTGVGVGGGLNEHIFFAPCCNGGGGRWGGERGLEEEVGAAQHCGPEFLISHKVHKTACIRVL